MIFVYTEFIIFFDRDSRIKVFMSFYMFDLTSQNSDSAMDV